MTSLLDSCSKPILKYLKHKEFVVLVVCGAAFLLGIPNVMQVTRSLVFYFIILLQICFNILFYFIFSSPLK